MGFVAHKATNIIRKPRTPCDASARIVSIFTPRPGNNPTQTIASAQYFGLPGPSGNDCIAAGFSNAVRLPPNAQLVLTAGQAGIDLNTERLVESSPEAQIEACFDCCHVALKLAGVLDGLASAFRITSFLPDQRHDPLMMEIWRRRYPDHRPVWTSVGSGTLGLPGMIVELQAEACIAPSQVCRARSCRFSGVVL